MRVLALGALVATASPLPACRGRKSDEVLLREKTDVLTVHLYVALKLALLRSGDAPEVRALREQMLSLARFGQRYAQQVSALNAQPGGLAQHLDGLVPSAAPTAAAPTAPAPELHASDVLAAARALWTLRSEGARLARSPDEGGLAPLLPVLLGPALTPELRAALDANTEHALLLVLEFLLRVDERVPVPIPPEVILYEASRTNAAALRLPGLAGPVRAVKGVVFAEHGLCDLSSREAAALPAPSASDGARLAGEWATLARTLTTREARVSEGQARAADAGLRALAHGAAGVCYLGRGDDANSTRELAQFVEAAHAAGVAPSETALVRAYLALARGDGAGARAALAEARSNPSLGASERAELERLDEAVRAGSMSTSARYAARARVLWLAARVFTRSLERAGVLDAVRSSDAARALEGYTGAARRVLGQGVALPEALSLSRTRIEQQGRGLLQRLWRRE